MDPIVHGPTCHFLAPFRRLSSLRRSAWDLASYELSRVTFLGLVSQSGLPLPAVLSKPQFYLFIYFCIFTSRTSFLYCTFTWDDSSKNVHHPYWALTGRTSLMASTVEWKPQSIHIRLGRFGRKFRKSSSYKSMVSIVLFPSLSRYSSPKKSAFPSLLFFPWADNLSWARLVIP